MKRYAYMDEDDGSGVLSSGRNGDIFEDRSGCHGLRM